MVDSLQTEHSLVDEKEEMSTRNTKSFLTCADCGKESVMAPRMPEARELAEEAGWQVGMRGANRINGWEEDFCEICKLSHPRTYCGGYHRSPCRHRALYTVVRPKDDYKVYACGSHLTPLINELSLVGKLELERTPI